MRDGLIPRIAPCFATHNLALGGAQTAVLRMIGALPPWLRERTTLYSQSQDMPLLDAAVQKHGFSVGQVTNVAPEDPSCWVVSYADLVGLPERPSSLLLHSWDDAGWRYINKTYGQLSGLRVAAVSRHVLDRYAPWIERQGHEVAGILPPPVTEWCIGRGRSDEKQLVVGWMGRPLESKGLLSLPHLLALDPRIMVRAYTGADTGGSPHVRRTQQEAIDALLKLAKKLKVSNRLDLRPLDFDPFSYRQRLAGVHVLLGNSRQEGFLLTAAEALSCGVPVVVTRECGVADYIREGVNGCLIDWNDNPRRLAKASIEAIHRAASLDSIDCLRSVQSLSLAAHYRAFHGQTLAKLTHCTLRHEPARVTVGVRVHHGTRIEDLDDALSSLAGQTYKKFTTMLLADGPQAWGEMLAERYELPLLCTNQSADITHCSWLHRQAVETCGTEFYKPLDYDDQLLPGYLERAVATLDRTGRDVYGCLLWTLENGEMSHRRWPHKPLETMFTGNSDDNMLPHSSVLMRTAMVKEAGNYQERAVGLGADDYHLWYRIHRAGGTFIRDDEARHVVYRIHDRNSLRIRRSRYGPGSASPGRRELIAGATAASLALWLGPRLPAADAMLPLPDPKLISSDQLVQPVMKKPNPRPEPSHDLKHPHSQEAVLEPHS